MLMKMSELPLDGYHPISKENADSYPYYELLMSMITDGIKTPIFFEEVDGELTCVEGRHRFHLLALLYKTDPEYFNKVIGDVEVIVCDKMPYTYESPNGVDSTWKNMVHRVRGIYEKFIRPE